MDLQFGENVYKCAIELQEQGRDANQTAKILFDRDEQGYNYGIGIVLTGTGAPARTSPALLEYAAKELETSTSGSYMNSARLLDDVKTAALHWQRVPEEHWDKFVFGLPSDAGTGAVKTAVELALMLNPALNAIGVEELGWPAYKAIAKVSRLNCLEFPAGQAIARDGVLPLYQAGPMNTTGLVPKMEVVEARAEAAARESAILVLDRAYSSFEYAGLSAAEPYDTIARKSYELQIRPFIERGVTFCLALSPTKSFVSFALRPCGMLAIFCPDSSARKEITTMLNHALRARGSSFEHPVTRAFVKAMVNDRERLEQEHLDTLKRVAEAEALWRKYVKGTPIEYIFSEDYAGLFRNPQARENAAVHIYNQHIYPVFSSGRCRLNVTGIPNDEELARKHAAAFAEQCF